MVEMKSVDAIEGRTHWGVRFSAAVVLLCKFALLSACSMTPGAVEVAQSAGTDEPRLRFSRIEQPVGDPGSVTGGALAFEDQQKTAQAYREGLYASLAATFMGPRVVAACSQCPILSSRILAIDEHLEGFPSKTELTVLFRLARSESDSDVFWSKVIRKTGQSYNAVGLVRVKSARESAVAEVLRELVTVLPADIAPRR
jgi:hypothetical protein